MYELCGAVGDQSWKSLTIVGEQRMQYDQHAQSVVTPGDTVTPRERSKGLTTSLMSLCSVLMLMASLEHIALADEADNSAGRSRG
jgi:hypothetical protein